MNISLQRDVMAAALSKMASNGYFDICSIDALLKLTGGIPPRQEYDALRSLHCVHYRDMSPRLRLELPRLIQVVLESQPMRFDLEIIETERKQLT